MDPKGPGSAENAISRRHQGSDFLKKWVLGASSLPTSLYVSTRLHPREAGTYLEVLEEVLMLGPLLWGVSNQPSSCTL